MISRSQLLLGSLFAAWFTCGICFAQTGTVKAGSATLSRISPKVTPPPPIASDQQRSSAVDEDGEPEDEGNPADDKTPGPPGNPLVDDEAVELVTPQVSQNIGRAAARPSFTGLPSPAEFVLGAKNQNTKLTGILVEPSVSNQSRNVLFLSNNQANYSTDGGATFQKLTLPSGPSSYPNYCCDQTIVYDTSHSAWIWSALYQAKGAKFSVILISVIRNLPTVDCTYMYDPAGGAGNMIVDYPQLGLGDNKFYLATSESRNGWLRSRMMRFALNDIATCPASVLGESVDYSPANKRMFTPVRGAKEIMYWGNLENTTQLRIWTWPEADTSASWALKTVQASTFADPDCRGGANGNDWMKKKGWHIYEGFMRGALARGGNESANPAGNRLQFFWNSAGDAKHAQAYVRSAVFDLPGLNLVAEPNIHNPDFCFGYADAHPNARGDLGIVIAFGGRAGGGGPALSAGVGIEDEYTPKYRVKTVYVTTQGTDMPSTTSQRYGDYLSVKPHEPCSLWWIAGNYALTNGGKTPVGEYVEFGRQRDRSCWDRWKDISPPALP